MSSRHVVVVVFDEVWRRWGWAAVAAGRGGGGVGASLRQQSRLCLECLQCARVHTFDRAKFNDGIAIVHLDRNAFRL